MDASIASTSAAQLHERPHHSGRRRIGHRSSPMAAADASSHFPSSDLRRHRHSQSSLPSYYSHLPTALAAVACLLLLVGSADADDSAFTSQPKQTPYYVTEGEQGPVLDCSVAGRYAVDKQNYELKWTKVLAGTPTLITLGDRNYFGNDYELMQSASEGSYSLRIKKVNFTNDNGEFFCSLSVIDASKQFTARRAVVVVLVRPDPPEISDQLPVAANEGDLVHTTCQSHNGNPPPLFKWLFNNKTEVPDDWQHVTNASKPDQASSSRLEWRATPTENGAFLVCQIWNQAIGPNGAWLEVETRRISVMYKPRVTVGPVEQYNVEDGQRAKLTCTADANPEPAQYVWEQVGGTERWETKDKEFVAEKRHAGEYKCRATNSIGVGESSLTLNVLYAPIVKVHPILNPAEGDDVVLQCDVDANPPADSVMWEGPNGANAKGPKLELSDVTRQAAGNYTCTAKNMLTLYSARSGSIPRTGTGVTVVDIRHKPGQGIITPSKSPVVVGDEVTLRCSADDQGSPKAQYRWASPGKDFDSNSISAYTIAKAQLTDAGEYRCLPWNDVGSGEPGNFTLQVIEPARLTRLLALEKLLIAGEEGPTLECAAQGHPAPNISWFKDQLPIVTDGHYQVETVLGTTNCDRNERCSYPVTGRLRWTSAVRWNDKGQYSCQAFNGAGEPHKSDTIVRVDHAPVILNDRYPNEALAAVDVGSTAVIVCHVSARPEPTFRWYRNSEEITTSGRYFIRPGANGNNSTRDDYESLLEIRDTTDTDLGAYMCKAVNGRGDPAEVTIKLQPKTKPQSPSDIEMFSSSYNWMMVGWAPGFDGGDAQSFQLEYRQVNPWTGRADPDTIKSVKLRQDNMTVTFVTGKPTLKRAIAEDSVRSFVVHNITGLTPLNTYFFRVMAMNSLGDTDWTELSTATTQDVPTHPRIPKPEGATYHSDTKKLLFEPSKTPDDYCLMVYVQMSSQPWHSVDCKESAQPVTDLVGSADNMRVRFCRKAAPFVCSEPADVLVASSLSAVPWSVIVPVALLVLALIVIVGIIGLCCRMRTSGPPAKKAAKRKQTSKNDYEAESSERARPKVSGPFPTAEPVDKTLTVHGSQADSGVFTMGSQFNGQQQQHTQLFNPNGAYDTHGHSYTNGALRSSFEDGVDRWGSAADPYEYANDPYGNVYGADYGDGYGTTPAAGNGGYYDPYGNPQGMVDLNPAGTVGPDYDDDASSFSTPNSRRVMREIIV